MIDLIDLVLAELLVYDPSLLVNFDRHTLFEELELSRLFLCKLPELLLLRLLLLAAPEYPVARLLPEHLVEAILSTLYLCTVMLIELFYLPSLVEPITGDVSQ